jgi:two-component system NarL family response regulator
MNSKLKSTKASRLISALKSETDLQDVEDGPATKKIRIMIADDHAVILEGLVAIINRQADMTVVAQASDGQEAVEKWDKNRPDVTLLDLRMPKLDGIRVINAIRREDASARIIVLTTYDTDEDIYRAIKAGAKAYLLKDAGREVLLDCICKVHSGETCLSTTIAAKLAGRLSADSPTAREIEVLSFLAQGKSNKEIGESLFISEMTVKSHLKSISAKLNVVGRTEVITEALRRGLVHL